MSVPDRPLTARHGAGGQWPVQREALWPVQREALWPPVTFLTVLYDANCRLCRAARRWLESRAALVPMEFLPAGSAAARARFPSLDPAATLRDLTVVADTGAVYAGDAGWLTCLWALDGYREMAGRLASPALLPVARRVISMAAAIREKDRARYGDADAEATTDCDDDACALPDTGGYSGFPAGWR